MVQYSNKVHANTEIIVTFSDSTQHELMMQGLIAGIRLAATNPDPRESDSCEISYMCDLLASMLPNEFQLNDGIKVLKDKKKPVQNDVEVWAD